MQLSMEQIRSATQGFVRFDKTERGIFFSRMSESQEKLYAYTTEARKGGAGVKMEFVTDSTTLFLKVFTECFGTRGFFRFEVFADDNRVGTLDNFEDTTPVFNEEGQVLPADNFRQGEFEKSFLLGAGMKTVRVYFPYTAKVQVIAVGLDDGSAFAPVKRGKKLIAYGDSITHGYDAKNPSQAYIVRLADALGAELYNKAIAGDVFSPKLLAEEEPIDPDYITVAYGTNDWHGCPREEFETKCPLFYQMLSEKYPRAKIFAITPVWRYTDEVTRVGTLQDARNFIEQTASKHPNVTVIRGDDLIPPDRNLFYDTRLHPSDAGFDHYFRNLLAAILPHITEEKRGENG